MALHRDREQFCPTARVGWGWCCSVPQAWLGQAAPTASVGVTGCHWVSLGCHWVSQTFSPALSHWMSPELSAVPLKGSALLPPSSAPPGQERGKQSQAKAHVVVPRSWFRAVFGARMRLLLITA